MHRIVVNQVHVLLESVVHKCDTVATATIVLRCLSAIFLEPLNLVPLDAVHATRAVAVRSASTEEPESSVNHVGISGVFDRQIVGVLMKHRVAVVVEEVGQGGRILVFALDLEHLMRGHISLVVMEPGHDTVRNL